jgi:hypothetical protein
MRHAMAKLAKKCVIGSGQFKIKLVGGAQRSDEPYRKTSNDFCDEVFAGVRGAGARVRNIARRIFGATKCFKIVCYKKAKQIRLCCRRSRWWACLEDGVWDMDKLDVEFDRMRESVGAANPISNQYS